MSGGCPIPSDRRRIQLDVSDLAVLEEQITIRHGEASETTGEPGAGCFQQAQSGGAARTTKDFRK